MNSIYKTKLAQAKQEGVFWMFPNLRAEQARKGMTNQAVANYLGVSRITYESKKKSGRFTVPECKRLIALFQQGFDYLFATEPDTDTKDKA